MTRKKTAEKYHAILDGALKTIAEYGFHDSKVAWIAEAAGVADGTVYLYFKNKEDILISLFRERLGRLIQHGNERIQQASDAKEALYVISHTHFSVLENDIPLAYVTQIELRQRSFELRQEIGKTVKPYFDLIESVITQGLEEGTFRPDLNVKRARMLIFGTLDEIVSSWLLSKKKIKLTDQVEATVDLFLKGMDRTS